MFFLFSTYVFAFQHCNNEDYLFILVNSIIWTTEKGVIAGFSTLGNQKGVLMSYFFLTHAFKLRNGTYIATKQRKL